MSAASIPTRQLLQYGFIALPVAFAGFPLYVLAPDFYATQHGLSLTLMGGLLLAIRLFDAVQDPLIGWRIDRLQGRFRLVVAVAGAVLCLAVAGLFNSLVFSPALWFTLCMAIAVSAYSVLTIALGARATLWTRSDGGQEQTRIASMREMFGLIGLVTAVSAPTLLAVAVTAEQVFPSYSLLLALLMLAGIIGFWRLPPVARGTEAAATAEALSFRAGLRSLAVAPRRFFLVYGLSMLASSIPAVLVVFYVRDYLGAGAQTGLFLLLYFLSGAAAMPLWRRLSAVCGKAKAWGLAHVLAVAGFSAAAFLAPGDSAAYAAVCVVSGLALGADLTLPPALLAEEVQRRGQSRYAATHYAVLAFLAKASLALASALALPMLDAAGFKPQAANDSTALTTLALGYALVPCFLKLSAAGLLYRAFIRPQPQGVPDHAQNPASHRSIHHA